MSKKKKYQSHVIFYSGMFDLDVCDAVSSTECTGLIPFAPKAEDELSSYNEIISYSPKSADVFLHNS